MFGNFGGIFAQFFGTSETGGRMFPIIHIGDEYASSGFGHAQGSFGDQVTATILAADFMEEDFQNFFVPLNRSLNMVMIPSIQENFMSGGRPEPWEPLSGSRIETRGSMEPILVDTGTMKTAITSPSNWNVTHVDVWVKEEALPHYAGFNQTGTSKMPARTFVLFQDDDRDLIEAIFSQWIDEKIEEWWND